MAGVEDGVEDVGNIMMEGFIDPIMADSREIIGTGDAFRATAELLEDLSARKAQKQQITV